MGENKNKLIAVNVQTWDKFDLPLLEAANDTGFKTDLADELITLPDLCIAEYRRCNKATDKKSNSKD